MFVIDRYFLISLWVHFLKVVLRLQSISFSLTNRTIFSRMNRVYLVVHLVLRNSGCRVAVVIVFLSKQCRGSESDSPGRTSCQLPRVGPSIFQNYDLSPTMPHSLKHRNYVSSHSIKTPLGLAVILHRARYIFIVFTSGISSFYKTFALNL